MEGETLEPDGPRLEKRRKLESAIVGRPDFSDGGLEHPRNGSDSYLAARKSSRSTKERLKGTANAFPGSERSRMTQIRTGKDSEIRSNGQFSRDGAVEETAATFIPRRRSEVQISTGLDRKRGNLVLKTDTSVGRENLKRDRDTDSRSVEAHKKGRDDREYKRGRDEVDKDRDHDVKRQARESKIFFEDHEGSRKDKGVHRGKLKDHRACEVQAEIVEEGRRAKEFRDEERKHGDSRRLHVKEVKQRRYVVNGTKANVHGEDPSTRRRSGKHFQFRRVSGNLDNFRSRQDGFFKPNVDYTFAHCPRPRPRGAACGPDESHKRGHQNVVRDGHRRGRKIERDLKFIRDRGRIGETVVKERSFRRTRGVDEGRLLLNRNSDDRKIKIVSKENVDHTLRGVRAKGRRDDTDAKGNRHDHINKSQTVEGATIRRCRSKVVASLLQVEEEDVVGSIDNRKDAKGLAEGQGQEVRAQEEVRKDDQQQNEHDGKVQAIEAFKSYTQEAAGGKDVKVDHGLDIPREDILPPIESISGPLDILKYRDKRKRRNGSKEPLGKRVHKKEKPTDEVQEVQQSLDEQGTDDLKRETATKQHDIKWDVEERSRTEDTARRKSVELQQLKPVKGIREKIEKSNESLLRRQSVKVDRVKDGGGTDASSDKHRKHHGSSHSVSPNAQKRRLSPNHKEHGKSTSPRRFDKDRTDWEKFERERNNTLAAFDSRYRRFGGGTSGLGGYSPRRRRSEAAIKTPSPPPRSPERRKPRAWDLPPPGMDSIMVAAISAAHQAAVQHAVVTLATVTPSVPSSVLVTPVAAPVSVPSGLTSVPSMIPSLLQQVNPAVTAVTLTQATRPLRRLYVGNVPATVSDGELLEFMNAAMLSANANHLPGTKPCINCSVNVEKSYAFAEFITPEDATAALAFDGVTLHGTTLKIRRPKDFVLPANGGAETASPVLDMVSSSVPDSPRKVFVGGISLSLTADKVKEIVTAFGQLKAYHWEVDHKTQPPQAFAFLEYMDPAATLKVCAGLNGMRLGTGFLTVVQATPDANPQIAAVETPFYGIPERAKTLLEVPTRVLELKNLVTQEELPGLSEEEVEELIEDVRLECARFGNVKSTHMVRPSTHAEPEIENIGPSAHTEPEVENTLPSTQADPEMENTLLSTHVEPEVESTLPSTHAEPEVENTMPSTHAEPEVENTLPLTHAEPEVENTLPSTHAEPKVENTPPPTHAETEFEITLSSTHAEAAVQNAPEPHPICDKIIVREDSGCGRAPESVHDQTIPEAVEEELLLDLHNNLLKVPSSSAVQKEITGFCDGPDAQVLHVSEADSQSSDQLHEVIKGETCDCPTNEASCLDTEIENSQPVLGETQTELRPNAEMSQTETRGHADSQELPHALECDTHGSPGCCSELVEATLDTSRREWETRHAGKVFVEFSREESARQAAYSLHGRTFAGHEVAVSYFPLKLYQKTFNKGLGPRTIEEKQALALAVQGHLTAHIKD